MRPDCAVLVKVYTDLIISTIVDLGRSSIYAKRLYGLDNFYYRRFPIEQVFPPFVYTDLIISTIVDKNTYYLCTRKVYTDLIISTIVDQKATQRAARRSIRT